MEKLSVIIPAYRAEKYLPEAAASVRGQGWPGVMELIIIDDGSEDGTLDLAKRLGDVVLTKQRGGAASARNMGLRAATGGLFLLLDADDLLTAGALEALYAPLSARPELMGVFSRARDFLSPELTPEQKSALRPRRDSYGGVLPGCSLIRREVFEQIGLFDESLRTGETVAWQMKLRDAKLPTANIDYVTLERRLHLTNTGRADPRRELLDYAAILRGRMKKS